MRSCAALVPALDCEATIADVVRGARRHVDYVQVVDDGSTDRTGAAARAAGAWVVRHDRTRGKGAALQTGFRRLGIRGYGSVLTLDGDGQHLESEIPALLDEARRHPEALIVGARRRDEAGIAPAKLFGNRFADWWVELATGLEVPDSQSGFRVYPLPEILALPAHGDHFEYETELLLLAARRRIEIRFVPVDAYYPPPEERVSHFDPFADTVRIINVVLGRMLRFRR